MVQTTGLEIERAVVETAEEDGRPVSFFWIVARKPRGPSSPEAGGGVV